MSDVSACPHCAADMQGDPIPEQDQEAFGGKTHFSRLIGISNGDSIQWYKCPDCGKRIERNEPWLGYRTCSVEVHR